MYEQTRFDRLELVVRFAEAAPRERFNMRHWWCGTAGCLVGTYCMNVPDSGISFVRICPSGNKWSPVGYDTVENHFGMSGYTARFVFGGLELEQLNRLVPATQLTQQQAIARLRKTIRYLRRKRDLWRDHEDLMALSKQDRRERLLAPIPA